MNTSNEHWLSQRESAERLGICRKRLRKIQRSGAITPVIQTRGTTLFAVSDIEALAAKLTRRRRRGQATERSNN